MHKTSNIYDKVCHPVSINGNIGDAILIKVQPKFKLDCNYHVLYRVNEVIKVKLVNDPHGEAILLYKKFQNVKTFSREPILVLC